MHEQVIYSFLKRNKFKISYAIAEQMYDDLFLLHEFYAQMEDEGREVAPFVFTSNIDYLDLLWHEMILHTRFYFEYCNKNFGRYIHHDPVMESAVSNERYQVAKIISEQVELLIENLGEDFVQRIYGDYPKLCKGK